MSRSFLEDFCWPKWWRKASQTMCKKRRWHTVFSQSGPITFYQLSFPFAFCHRAKSHPWAPPEALFIKTLFFIFFIYYISEERVDARSRFQINTAESFNVVFLSDPSPIIGYACHWLTHWLTNSVTFSKLYWCDPGVWRCQLKTYWGCCCCWCWWWVSCWQQLVADLEAEVWS